jgi:hypothetical protein
MGHRPAVMAGKGAVQKQVPIIRRNSNRVEMAPGRRNFEGN